jgi:PPK2 family polyphosphate:nucleotide phosphotransferase
MALLTPLRLGARPTLSTADARPPKSLPSEKKKLRQMTAKLVERIAELQRPLYAERRRAILVVLQGRDTSGKDGTIRHVFGGLNPQGVTVTSFAAPTDEERSRDFLWRVHRATPGRGHIGIFNRSHYEDVLVVRARGLAPRREWEPRFDEINAFEQLLARSGTTVLKFCLHISKDEQRKRLIARLDDPTKNWKFRPGDLEDRDRWSAFTAAYRDALSRCSTRWAPWYVVPADHKPARDYLVAQVLYERLKALRPKFPPADPKVLKYRKQIR